MSNNSTSSDCDAILAKSAGTLPVYNHTTQMAMTAVLGILLAVTFLGNIVLIMTIVQTRRLHTRANFFVASLATADIGVSLLVMPFGIYQQATNKDWRLGELICLLSTSVDVMLCTVSILHLLCLCLDRYLAICHPYVLERVGKRVTRRIIAACWVLPIFISFLPIMNKWNTIGIEHYIACVLPSEGVCVFLVNAEFAVICSIMAFYIPVTTMTVCYWRIYQIAQRQMADISKTSFGKVRKKTKAATTLVIVMACFSICWAPFFLLNVIDPFIGYRIPYVAWLVAQWLGYSNSAMNPFLFSFFNSAFREGIFRVLGCKKHKIDIEPSQTSQYFTAR